MARNFTKYQHQLIPVIGGAKGGKGGGSKGGGGKGGVREDRRDAPAVLRQQHPLAPLERTGQCVEQDVRVKVQQLPRPRPSIRDRLESRSFPSGFRFSRHLPGRRAEDAPRVCRAS